MSSCLELRGALLIRTCLSSNGRALKSTLRRRSQTPNHFTHHDDEHRAPKKPIGRATRHARLSCPMDATTWPCGVAAWCLHLLLQHACRAVYTAAGSCCACMAGACQGAGSIGRGDGHDHTEAHCNSSFSASRPYCCTALLSRPPPLQREFVLPCLAAKRRPASAGPRSCCLRAWQRTASAAAGTRTVSLAQRRRSPGASLARGHKPRPSSLPEPRSRGGEHIGYSASRM